MNAIANARRAYQSSSESRSLRDQEADLFYRVNGALRDALSGGNKADRVRALADNHRLWLTVTGVLSDPRNGLPEGLRVNLLSIGRTVRREMDSPAPDLDFLIAVNENIAAGLQSAP